ncbi:MAG TPA: hypothetical protein VH083_18025 [Myxococcales bacterium]|nr:hypothetical protein [Myxococcales bacterium]
MQLELIPLLQVQYDLYAQPRSMARFNEYLARMIDGEGELRLPLSSMNPMAKDHAARAVSSWMQLDAENLARDVLPHIARSFAEAPGKLRLGLVVADDAGGGWTNFYTTDFAHRFESQGLLERDFAVALLWVSIPPDAAVMIRELMTAAARAAWQRTRGLGKTLRDLLEQEHFALTFAGGQPKPMPAQHLDATGAPTLFAALYGDEAAVSLGYSPLGVEAAL